MQAKKSLFTLIQRYLPANKKKEIKHWKSLSTKMNTDFLSEWSEKYGSQRKAKTTYFTQQTQSVLLYFVSRGM